MKLKLWLILFGLLTGGLLSGCKPSQTELDARATQIAINVFATQTAQAPTPTPTPTLTSTFTPTPKPTATPTATLTPTPTPTPTPLAPADIFARVSPSIGFIETPGGTGSGVLIEDGYLVTNAHVVWPFQKVRVVFQDGSEYLDTPVLNWDLLADLAIIGPLQTSITPLSFVDGEQQVIGSDVYLIGYPGEVEQFPQPTITRGLISRLREWESLGITYFQTDATIAGGQSGGVLVSKEGEVVGISGFAFTEAGFGMVASAPDILPRIQKLIAGEDIAGLGYRFLPSAEEQFESDFTLHHGWERSVYIINEPARTTVDLTAEGENNAVLAFEDMFGNLLISADEGNSGVETGSAITEWEVPHFVVIGQSTESAGEFHLSSNRGLIPHDDVDDGVSVTTGQTVLGSMDYPGDLDYFTLELSEGDLINLTVDSIMFDPLLGVGYPEAKDEQLVFDDDSGGGLFGTNAELTYQAPHSGSYFITIEDRRGYSIGGYTLKLAPPPPGATPVVPPPTPTPTPQPTQPPPPPTSTPLPAPSIPMTSYQSAQYPFVIQHPAQWAEQPKLKDETVAYVGDNATFAIVEEDLVAVGAGEMTLDEYVDLILFALPQFVENYKLVSSQRTVNAQGLPVQIIVFTAGPEGILKFSRLVYLHENKIGFNATYLALRGQHQELEPLIAYSFSTFQVTQ